MELQKTVEGIFILGLQQFKAKSEKTISDSHAISRINSNTKTGMQDLKTWKLENFSSNKNYNNCNTTTTKNSCNNDSAMPRSKNPHMAPLQWDMLSTTSDTITTSDNGRLINIMPSTSTGE